MRIAMAWSQWQSGTSKPILVDTTTPLPHLECRWIKSLRQFLKYSKTKIHVDRPFCQHPERIDDFHIMDYALQTRQFDEAELCILNYCRLHIHVTTVSELFNASGSHMLIHMYECRRSPWMNPATVITLQPRPSEYQIRYQWQRLCRHWIHSDLLIANSMAFGEWITPCDKLRLRRSTYYLHSTFPIVYHWIHDAYWECHPTAVDQTVYIPNRPTDWTPDGAVTPIDVHFCHTPGIPVV